MKRVPAALAGRGLVVPLLLVGLPALSISSHAGEGLAFRGSVKSTLGTLLEGVEVLIVPKAASSIPVVTTTSDHEGSFEIADLSPGPYRLAALKHGYVSFVGDVDTRMQSWIELILRPRAGLAPEEASTVTEDASWALRLPRRPIWRDVESSETEDQAEPSRVFQTQSFREPMQWQVDQLFAVGPAEGDGRQDSGPHGSETRIRVASAVGERARIQVRGHRESFRGSGGAASDPTSSARDAAAGLNLAFSYDTTPDTQVSLDAYYRHRDLHWRATLPEVDSSQTRQQRSWGGVASWSRQLDPTSRVALAVDFQNAALRLPGTPGEAARTAVGASPISNRSIGAAASYDAVPSEYHEVQVAFQARALDLPAPRLRLATGDPLPGFTGVEGFTLGVNARDTWRINGPFSLVYGLGYKHVLSSHDASLIVPQLGGRWSVEGLSLSFLASYHAVTDWREQQGEAIASPFRTADRVGYEARVEVPVAESIRFQGSTSYAPIQFELLGGAAGVAAATPIYLTDGNAAVRQNRVTVIRETEGRHTYAEVAHGRVEGTLATILPYEIAFQNLAQRELRFTDGRVGLRFAPVGTHVLLEYREVEERLSEESLDGATLQRSLELRLIQDLMRMQALGRWRLLMGLQVATLETESEDWLSASNDAIVDALGGRLRAGLSVEF